MERREFLRYGITVTGALALGAFRVQADEPRSAIVIGVDQAGDLPKLRAAKSGAREVGRWLKNQGFSVSLFVDDDKPVRVAELFDAIDKIVSQGNQQQLVIYFAGHGFVNNYSEFWLLSQAPDNPNEAVSLVESVALARQSGIPNVVFISDACRSRSDSLRTERVRGSLIFPNNRGRPVPPSDVDQFLATLVGEPSWEVPVTESTGHYQGIYTTTFLDAFHHPDFSMIRKIDGKDVVPNYQLKHFLAREVPRRAQEISINLNQRPDSQVMSGEDSYIGIATSSTPAPPAPPPPLASPAPPATIFDVAIAELNNAGIIQVFGVGGLPRPNEESINIAAVDSGFDAARETIIQARGLPQQFTSGCGFTIAGGPLKSVTASHGVECNYKNLIDTATVEVDLRGNRACSIALRFINGTGTILAALDGFIGNVVVDSNSVANVSYIPAPNNYRREFYIDHGSQLVELHAAVATAARFGVFRIEGSRNKRYETAGRFADRIRVLKGIDPTLGIYAAYAYDDAGLPQKVDSVALHLNSDLGIDLFDVAMLAGKLNTLSPHTVPIVPMLSQGWSLLRVKEVLLPPWGAEIPNHLIPGLWTTFNSIGMDIIEKALRESKPLA